MLVILPMKWLKLGPEMVVILPMMVAVDAG